MIVDWFDASRGDAVADVARSLRTLLCDGASPPPTSRERIVRRWRCWPTRISDTSRHSRDIDQDLLARWQAVSAVARVTEGVCRPEALEDLGYEKFVHVAVGHRGETLS